MSVAFLPIMAALTAVLKVGLVTITVRMCADGDRPLTLQLRHSSLVGGAPWEQVTSALKARTAPFLWRIIELRHRPLRRHL